MQLAKTWCYLLESQPLKSFFSPKFGHISCIGRVTSSLQGSLNQYSHIEKCLSLSYLKPRSGPYIHKESLFPSFVNFNHYETLYQISSPHKFVAQTAFFTLSALQTLMFSTWTSFGQR